MSPLKNPFCSLKLTIDENEQVNDSRIICTNHSLYIVQLIDM